jgi:hypothetical protein
MFRFTIRDVLWLTVVVGLSLGWYVHYQRLTRPPKLYRDEEIYTLKNQFSRYIVDDTLDPPRLLVPESKPPMPLSQVFKTLKIDPNRLTHFHHDQQRFAYLLSWQLSPSYLLICETSDSDDGALAFDDPNRNIYGVWIRYRDIEQPVPPQMSDTAEGSDTTTPRVEPLFYTPPWKREPPPPSETLSGHGPIMPVPHSKSD